MSRATTCTAVEAIRHCSEERQVGSRLHAEGDMAAQFEDAFARYLPLSLRQPQHRHKPEKPGFLALAIRNIAPLLRNVLRIGGRELRRNPRLLRCGGSGRGYEFCEAGTQSPRPCRLLLSNGRFVVIPTRKRIMRQNEQHLYEGSRSTARLRCILVEDGRFAQADVRRSNREPSTGKYSPTLR